MKYLVQFVVMFCLVPAGLRGQSSFEITGELRSRVEAIDNSDFNSERLDGRVFVQNRMRLGVERNFARGIGLFVQIQDSRLWGEEGTSLASIDAIDMHQAYVNIEHIANSDIVVRIGRQELHFGSGRLIGRYDWHNVGRAFDAINLEIGRTDEQQLSVWSAIIRSNTAAHIMRNQTFSGAWFSTKRWPRATVEAYGLLFFDGRNYDSLTDLSVPIARSEDGDNHLLFWTFGSRIVLEIGKNMHLEFEGAYQIGERGPLDIRAFGYAVDGGYRFSTALSPEMQFGYTFGSGDSDAIDTEIGTFSSLFADAHTTLGNMDYASWSNTSSFYFGIEFQPTTNFEFGGTLHFIALAEDNDAFYSAEGYLLGAPNEVLRRAVPGAGTSVGRELDFYGMLHLRERLKIEAGVSLFMVDEFMKNTGGLRADDSFRGYLGLQVGF
ncbi:MAG: hypothetical protein DWQ05_16775 [Calditrichaeota bacterium]|nr:MAG: hypothetical protein DWQ05_16775 [Calditrichota bacterium]